MFEISTLETRWLMELITRPKLQSIIAKLQTIQAMKRTRELWKLTEKIM
jgi:hypothetical protein